MTAERTYKPIIAALLLALYAFIATPVQLWHHHNNDTSNQASHSNEKAITKSDGIIVDASCQVCSHHYSVYADDAFIVFITAIPGKIAREGFSLQSVITASVFTLSGRGPPAV